MSNKDDFTREINKIKDYIDLDRLATQTGYHYNTILTYVNRLEGNDLGKMSYILSFAKMQFEEYRSRINAISVSQ